MSVEPVAGSACAALLGRRLPLSVAQKRVSMFSSSRSLARKARAPRPPRTAASASSSDISLGAHRVDDLVERRVLHRPRSCHTTQAPWESSPSGDLASWAREGPNLLASCGARRRPAERPSAAAAPAAGTSGSDRISRARSIAFHSILRDAAQHAVDETRASRPRRRSPSPAQPPR